MQLIWYLLVLLASLATSPSAMIAQEALNVDLLRGRVIGPDSQPIAGALVTVKLRSGSDSRQTVTDRRGTYTVLFPGRTGDYVISVRAIGMEPRSIKAVRTGGEDVLITDISLSAKTLDPIRVTKQRPKVDRGNAAVGESANQLSETVPDLLTPLDPWNLLDPKRHSVLGIDASENALVVNGATVNAILPNPSMAGIGGRLITGSADPSYGGFSGGLIQAGMGSNADYHLYRLDLFLEPTALKFADRASERQSTTLSGTFSTWNPLFGKRVVHNSTISLTHSSAPLAQIPTTPQGLERLGVAPDSMRRFLELAAHSGIQPNLHSIPSNQRTMQLAWLGWFNFKLDAASTLSMTMNLGRSNNEGTSIDQWSLPTHGGSTLRTSGFATAAFSRYLGNGFLTTLSTTFNRSANKSTPYLSLPEGRVQVTSALSSGDSSTTWLSFGGNPTLGSRTQHSSWETRAITSWLSFDSKHRFSIGGGIRTERANTLHPINALGTFEFRSLADFQNGTATSFTRQTQITAQRVSGTHYYAHIGDSWTIRPKLSLQYGIRLETDRIDTRPALNPAIDSLFDRRTDFVPKPVSISPRVGLRWRYGPGNKTNGFLSGTVGRYQSNLGAERIGVMAQSTGLPASTRLLECVGSAVPSAEWTQYRNDIATIPTSCDDGTGATQSTLNAPTVSLFDAGYRPSTQWRLVLDWTNLRGIPFRVSLLHSRGTMQDSRIDLNLRNTPQFLLSSEGNRPVFVPESAIIPSTGTFAIESSRLFPAYGPVLVTVSDLRSSATQLSISKEFMFGPLGLSFQYINQSGRQQTRGFDGFTGNSPLAPTWGRTSLSRHTIGWNAGWRFSPRYSVYLNSYLQSGHPYTPIVSGDINGDGRNMDIAYIFDPVTARAQAIADGMNALLKHAPSSARKCLLRQIGRIADRNSCEGPWSGGLNMNISLDPRWMPHSSGIFIEVTNLAGAVDQLLHGNNRRGWGEPSWADPVLLVVDGFDPTEHQFRYQVNSRFGRQSAATVWRTPTILRFRVSTPIGPSLTTQQGRTMAKSVRATQGNSDAIKRNILFYSPFAGLFQRKDALKLTAQQEEAIHAAAARWQQDVDSLQVSLINYVEELSDSVSDKDIIDRVNAIRSSVLSITAREGKSLKGVLTENQLAILPVILRQWLTGSHGNTLGSEL